MEKILFVVFALLAFFLPIGFYCLILAAINRRARPLILPGMWDTIGLAFAMSGFFLVTAPMLISEFASRVLAVGPSAYDAWVEHWLVYAGYVAFVVIVLIVAIRMRLHKTMVYNVDTEQIPKALESTLVNLGVASATGLTHLTLTNAPKSQSTSFMAALAESPVSGASVSGASAGGSSGSGYAFRGASVTVDAFPAMCHVTLHWKKISPGARAMFEQELDKNLATLAPVENSSAGWFLNISGMIFGALVMVVLTFIALMIFVRRS